MNTSVQERAPAEAQAKPANVQRIFELQQSNRWRVAHTSAAQRTEKLRRLRAVIEANRAAIADAIYADFGKHPEETELSEIQLTLMELGHTIRHLPGWMRRVRVRTPLFLTGTRSEIRYSPKGVVLILAAVNYPFALIVAPLVSAIAAGNCAILRPSDRVPHTNRVLARILAEVFDEREVALVEGDASVVDRLLALPFDHTFFTGSTRVGKKIMAATAGTVTSLTLELGGKSPVIIDPSADVPRAAERVVWGKFMTAGQACVAPDYVFVHESRAQEFLAAARQAVRAFYGDTQDERVKSPDLTRVIDAPSVQRLAGLLEGAKQRGATVETGGHVDAAERYIAPTILSGVEPDSPIMADEIFGPILPVLTYRSADEVYRFVNSRGKPLVLYVFSRDKKSTEDILANTSSGGTVVNNVMLHLCNPNLPFGGAGESGFGNYHGFFGFKTFSDERAVLVQGRLSFQHLIYPPFGPTTHRLLKIFGSLRR
jgi:aldehyde dehydrogenase (NAD+)